MTDDELIDGLRKISRPIMVELARRGYNLRIDNCVSGSGPPVIVAVRRPRVVAG